MIKYTLKKLLKNLNLNKLDETIPNNLDEKALCKPEIENNRQRFNFKIFVPVAACLILMVGLGGFAIAAEFKEYNAAEGLSRKDLKEVCRSFTTNRFMNEAIYYSVPDVGVGVEILQQEPTPEELSALQNSDMQTSSKANAGIDYLTLTKYKLDKTLGFNVFDKSIVDCRNNGETIWSTEISSFLVSDCTLTSNGTAAWGYTSTWSSEQPSPAWLARLDSNGDKLWEHQLAHGFDNENITAVLDNGDGTWAVISRGDFKYLCLSQYDMNGNELSFSKTQVGNKGIWKAICLGNSYLVHLGSWMDGDMAHLVKLDRDGNITGNFIYESNDCDYYIVDMTEFEDRVYLSAYAVPKQTDNVGRRNEIANIFEYAHNKENWEISSEELTPIVQDNYTAILLLCDPVGGELKNFYSVKGSLGGKLAVEEDQLKWNVESIASTFFSPYTSSFSIGGECLVHRYSFDKSGVIIGCEDTGEITYYRR